MCCSSTALLSGHVCAESAESQNLDFFALTLGKVKSGVESQTIISHSGLSIILEAYSG